MATKTVRVIRIFEVDVPVEYGATPDSMEQQALDVLGAFNHAATSQQIVLLPGLAPEDVQTTTVRDAPADVDSYSPDPMEG